MITLIYHLKPAGCPPVTGANIMTNVNDLAVEFMNVDKNCPPHKKAQYLVDLIRAVRDEDAGEKPRPKERALRDIEIHEGVLRKAREVVAHVRGQHDSGVVWVPAEGLPFTGVRWLAEHGRLELRTSLPTRMEVRLV